MFGGVNKRKAQIYIKNIKNINIYSELGGGGGGGCRLFSTGGVFTPP